MAIDKQSELMDEIRRAIIFYESKGWNWISVVAFLSEKANGGWKP